MTNSKLVRTAPYAARLLAALCLGSAVPAALSASGYEFDGVGARNVARGGAAIADASDWTAIYWNPANLASVTGRQAGLELRAGSLTSKDGNSFKDPFVTFPKTKSSPSFVLGSAGGVVPLRGKSALGMGVYIPIMQGVTFSDRDAAGLYNEFKSEGYAALAVTNVSYARELGGGVSAGAGVNLIYAKLKSKSVNDFAAYPLLLPTVVPDVMTTQLDGHGYGLEGVFGLKYRRSDALSYGLVFRTGSKFGIKGDASFHSAAGLLPDENTDFDLEFKHPPTSGIGAAWKARRALTLSADFTQTWWRGFSNKTTYGTQGTVLKDSANTYDWKNSYKVRAGAVWNYSEKVDVLFGYAFDTPAIDKGSIDFSTAIDVPMHRFSAAVTRKFDALDWTVGALAGAGRRRTGGVNYGVGGWYVMSEVAFRF